MNQLIEVAVLKSDFNIQKALEWAEKVNCRGCGGCCQNFLKNRLDEPCEYLNGSECLMYPVRPVACRTYPVVECKGKMAIELCDAGKELLSGIRLS